MYKVTESELLTLRHVLTVSTQLIRGVALTDEAQLDELEAVSNVQLVAIFELTKPSQTDTAVKFRYLVPQYELTKSDFSRQQSRPSHIELMGASTNTRHTCEFSVLSGLD